VQDFYGDLADYHQYMNHRAASAQPGSSTTAGSPAPASSNSATAAAPRDRKEQKRLEAEKLQRHAPIRKQQQAAEQRMEKLQAQLSTIEKTLGDNGLYDAARKDELNKLLQQQGQLKAELEEVEMTWMDLSEQLEAE